MATLLKTKNFYFVIYAFTILFILINNNLKAEQEFKIISDQIFVNQEKNTITGKGNVLIIGEKISSKANEIIYSRDDGLIEAKGNVALKDEYGNNYFTDLLVTKDDFSSLNANNVKIRLNDNSRLVGSKIIKKNDVNIISNADYTPCLKENYLIKNCPGWKVRANKVYHNLKTKTVHYDHARIHIFNDGQQIASAPVLLGKQKGDDLGPTDEPSWSRPVTPAGHFSIQLYRDAEAYKSYGTNTLLHFICNKERSLCTSLHQTWTAVQSENRPRRLLSPTSEDNYISNGCVNIDPQTWQTVLNLARDNRSGGSPNIHMTDMALFILPEDETRTMEYLGFSQSAGLERENQAQSQTSSPS